MLRGVCEGLSGHGGSVQEGLGFRVKFSSIPYSRKVCSRCENRERRALVAKNKTVFTCRLIVHAILSGDKDIPLPPKDPSDSTIALGPKFRVPEECIYLTEMAVCAEVRDD